MRYCLSIDFPPKQFGEPEKLEPEKGVVHVPRILVLHRFNKKSRKLEIDRHVN